MNTNNQARDTVSNIINGFFEYYSAINQAQNERTDIDHKAYRRTIYFAMNPSATEEEFETWWMGANRRVLLYNY